MLFLKQSLRRIYHKFFFAQPWGNYEIFQLLRRRRHRLELELELVRLRHCCQRRFCCFFCQRVKVSATLPVTLSLLLLLLLLLLLPVAVCLFAQSFISFEPPGGYSSVLCFVINTNTHTHPQGVK